MNTSKLIFKKNVADEELKALYMYEENASCKNAPTCTKSNSDCRNDGYCETTNSGDCMNNGVCTK